jgi:hypothetical protein
MSLLFSVMAGPVFKPDWPAIHVDARVKPGHDGIGKPGEETYA